jgi:hypothetical protein
LRSGLSQSLVAGYLMWWVMVVMLDLVNELAWEGVRRGQTYIYSF